MGLDIALFGAFFFLCYVVYSTATHKDAFGLSIALNFYLMLVILVIAIFGLEK